MSDRQTAPAVEIRFEPKPNAEIEIKLAGEPKALKSIFASPVLRGQSKGRARTRQLDAVYYDTADLRLRQRGLAFRVRKNGRRFEQTLKAGDGAGGAVLERGEWQVPLASPEPNLAAMPPEAGLALGDVLGSESLQPLFSTRVRRSIRRLTATDATGQPSLVEAALDLGTIEAKGRSVPIAELELELLAGERTALYRLARELDRLTPLRVETSSKAARGYALAADEPPAWHKATPVTLDRNDTVDGALAVILRDCLQHWTANEAAALDGRDPEGIHQMRVAMRRLRSALSLFRKVLPPEPMTWLKPETKKILGGLGPARDWDVFVTELVAPVRRARPDDPDLASLCAASEQARQEGYATARAMIRSPDYTGAVLRLGEWIEVRGWRPRGGEAEPEAPWLDRPVPALADHLLHKRHGKVLQLGSNFADLSATERHRVRIALKKLRYATEFFSSLYRSKRATAYLQSLKRLQDNLGHLNDLSVADRLLHSLLARADARRDTLHRAAGVVIGWHARSVGDFEATTIKRWTAFIDQKPFWR